MSKKKKLLEAIEVFGGKVVYDGWDCRGFMNVDVDISIKTNGVDDIQRFRVSLHRKDSYKNLVKKLRNQQREIGEWSYKRKLKELLP